MVSKKEGREIAFMIAAVAIVAIVGFSLQNMTSDRNEAVAGMAISLNSEAPTYSGILHLLETSCVAVKSDSLQTCNQICENRNSVCLPLEDNCDVINVDYACHCCGDISK